MASWRVGVDIDPGLNRNTVAEYEHRLHELGDLPNELKRRIDAALREADRTVGGAADGCRGARSRRTVAPRIERFGAGRRKAPDGACFCVSKAPDQGSP